MRGNTFQIKRSPTLTVGAILISLLFVTSILLLVPVPQTRAAPKSGIPPLSGMALYSKFAADNGLGAVSLTELLGNDGSTEVGTSFPTSLTFLASPNPRPQNEPSVAVKPSDSSNWVTGANDYGIGIPIGGGVYSHFGSTLQTYLTPFPLLFAKGGSGSQVLLETPIGTGDPSVVFSSKANRFFYASLGFSDTFCENGIFVFRSFDAQGKSWRRPLVPNLDPLGVGVGTVVYYDSGQNCSVFHDKEWLAVDNDPVSSHYGRLYVTWTLFTFANAIYKSSPIMMAFSDNNGNTFSSPIQISGSSATFCRTDVSGRASSANPSGACDEDQFSVGVVGPDHNLYVAFENQQYNGAADGFRDQYLVVKVDSGTFVVSGPSKVNPGTPGGTLIDGANDYPIQTKGGQGRATLCNSNFRLISAGNLAVNPTTGALYVVWSDDRAKAGQFPFPTFVGPRSFPYVPATSYNCPGTLMTDVDVFISTSNIASLSSWSTPVQVNQDKTPGTSNGVDQWFPWATVDPSTGNVYVVYHDRHYDTSPIANKLARTTLATSTDGGATFSTQDIQGFASNFDNSFFGVGSFIGDYNNAVFSSGHVYAAFTVVQAGKTDSDVAVFVSP